MMTNTWVEAALKLTLRSEDSPMAAATDNDTSMTPVTPTALYENTAFDHLFKVMNAYTS